jgi:RND family efflux transporter MFP subunit
MLAVSVVLTACGPKEEVAPEALRPVRTMVAGGGVSSETANYSGEVRARYESVLAFRIPGKISERMVEVGSHVKRGQPLLRLDAIQETLQTVSSEAEVEASKSRVAKLKVDIDRVEKLLLRKFASQAELDALMQGLSDAEAGLKAALARQQITVNQRAFAELRAERDGIVTAITSETGQVVAAGQPVVTVAADGEREVPVSVPESRIDELRRARSLTVTVLAAPAKRYRGVLRELAPDTDSITRTYQARISVADGDAALRLGMTASVKVNDGGAEGSIKLPLTAIYDKSGQAIVWLVDPKTSQVAMRKVALGGTQGDSVWIKEGLSGGETVVTAGVHMLIEGQKVLVNKTAPESAGTAP